MSRRTPEGKRALNCFQGRSASFKQRIVKKTASRLRAAPLSGEAFKMNRISSRLDAGVSGAIFRGFQGFPGVSGGFRAYVENARLSKYTISGPGSGVSSACAGQFKILKRKTELATSDK